MANAKKCDRCQKYYDGYTIKVKERDGNNVHYCPVNQIRLGNELNNYFGYDLCPKCMKEFFGFIRIPYELIDSEVEI